MFGRMHTVSVTQLKEAPLSIDGTGFTKRYDDQMLLEPSNYRAELVKLQTLLAETASELLRVLAADPMSVDKVCREYEEILVNVHQLLYKLRQGQAYERVKIDLKRDIENRRDMTTKLVKAVEEISSQVEALRPDEEMVG